MRLFRSMTRAQRLWLVLAATAWLIESYDIGLVSVVLVPFKKLWHLTASDVGLLVASATVGIVLGVVPAGFLADRLGRKRMMVGALAFYSVITALTALAPDWHAVLGLRLLAGIGLGAMFPLPYTLLTELSPPTARGAVAGLLDAFLSVGYFLAPLAGGLVLTALPLGVGWRVLFLVAVLGLLYAGVLARYLPESPRWLASKGRLAEAQAIWAACGATEPLAAVDSAPPRVSARTLWQSPYRRRTLMLWIAFPSILFIFYAIMNFMPSILVKEHIHGAWVYEFAALIMAASIPGKLIESWLVERWGRKPVIVGFTVIAGVLALAFPLARQPFAIVGLGMALAFFGISVDPAVKVFTAEQYPTVIRGTGVGMTEGVGRLIGGALAPYIMALFLSATGLWGTFLFIASVAFVGALVVLGLGQETARRPLEERVLAPRFAGEVR